MVECAGVRDGHAADAVQRIVVGIEVLALRATAWGEAIHSPRHEPAVEVKGATYTAFVSSSARTARRVRRGCLNGLNGRTGYGFRSLPTRKSETEASSSPRQRRARPGSDASEALVRDMDMKVYEQVEATTQKASYLMPDAHWGYGFPIWRGRGV